MSSAGFSQDLKRFAQKIEKRQRQVFVASSNIMHLSVTKGSPVTGAPGQPVDTSNLLNSWQPTYPADWVFQTATNVYYAPWIEDGVTAEGNQINLRSPVGGFHSVKLTRAGFQAVVNTAVQDVVG